MYMQVQATGIDKIKTLYGTLLEDYNRHVRPVKNQDKTLDVEFGLTLIKISYLDKETGSLMVNAWLQMVSSSIVEILPPLYCCLLNNSMKFPHCAIHWRRMEDYIFE